MILFIGIALIIIVGGTVAGLALSGGSSDQSQIKAAIKDFAVAVDEENTGRMIDLLCPEEASQITNAQDSPAATNRQAHVKSRPVYVSGIQVHGNAASAQVARPGQKTVTMHLSKLNGQWKLCSPSS